MIKADLLILYYELQIRRLRFKIKLFEGLHRYFEALAAREREGS